MKLGIREGSRTEKIVAAIKLGINTSKKLAVAFDTDVANIAPELDRLARMGEIQRGQFAGQSRGRPCIRWRVGPKPTPKPQTRFCTEAGCGRVYFAKGYCRKHYAFHRYAVRPAPEAAE